MMISFLKKSHVLFAIIIFILTFGSLITSSCNLEMADKKPINETITNVNPQERKEDRSCIYRNEEVTARSSDMKGLFDFGDTIRLEHSYYNCNDIYNGDVVFYSKAGDDQPIYRIVRGIPGDRFKVTKSNGTWHININGGILNNSHNTPYVLDLNSRIEILNYERAFLNRIPERKYLVITNDAKKQVDITNIDVIEITDIQGRVKFVKDIRVELVNNTESINNLTSI